MIAKRPISNKSPMKHTWHLIVCVVVLLLACGLAWERADLYSPTTAEFISLSHVGALDSSPRSPLEIIGSVTEHSQQHTPGYFLLLSIWGNLTGWEIAITRYLGIVFGLLSLAMMYRLARDFVAPIAGVFAIVIVASTAHYGFYYAHTRMYAMLMFVGTVTLWLYLRIVYQQKTVNRRDYVALFLSTYVLLNTHIFSFTFLLALGIYHLVFARKNWRWLWVSVAVTAGVILFSPYLVVIVEGLTRVVERRFDRDLNFIGFVETFTQLAFNGNLLLVAVPLIGLGVGAVKKSPLLRVYLILSVLHVLVVGFFAEFTETITAGGIRYFYGGWGTLILLVTAGLVVLYRMNRLTLLILPVWVIAGVLFMSNTSWFSYIEEDIFMYERSPIHLISRSARVQEQTPVVIGYKNLESFLETALHTSTSQQEYFFDRYDIPIESTQTVERFQEAVDFRTIDEPVIWIYFKEARVEDADRTQLENIMSASYELCADEPLGADSRLLKYHWAVLDCGLPSAYLSGHTSDIAYDVATVSLENERAQLFIVDQWATDDPANAEGLSFSYQLLTPEWERVAQLDIPLFEADGYRMVYLDVTDVPEGVYRLITVLYNPTTGERYEWTVDEQSVGDLLTIAEVTIP